MLSDGDILPNGEGSFIGIVCRIYAEQFANKLKNTEHMILQDQKLFKECLRADYELREFLENKNLSPEQILYVLANNTIHHVLHNSML
jgi:hypothetical protein